MTPAEQGQLAELVAQVYALHGKDYSKFIGTMWIKTALQYGCSLAQITEAIERHLMNPDTGQFVPKPADIVRMLGGTTKDRAALAWTRVDYAIRTAGPWVSVVFESRQIHIVISEMGGWIKLTQTGEKDFPFVANDFIARYRAAIMRSDVAHPSHLIGMSEAGNVQQGIRPGPPVAIGDPQRCALVYATGIGCPDPEKPVLLAYKSTAPTLHLAHDSTKKNLKKLG